MADKPLSPDARSFYLDIIANCRKNILSGKLKQYESTYRKWTTIDEMEFMRRIGKNDDPHKRLIKLRGYISSLGLRVEWGEMNKEKVIAEAMKLLEAEERKELKRCTK